MKKILNFIIISSFLSVPVISNDNVKTRQIADTCNIKKDLEKDNFDLYDIIELAICNNPNLHQSMLSVDIANNHKKSSFSEYLPNINVELDANKSEINDKITNTTVKGTTASLGVNLGWMIFDFGGREARVKKAFSYFESAEFKHNAILQDTIYSVIYNFYSTLQVKENVTALQKQKETAKKAFDIAKKKFQLGMTAKAELLQAETAFLQADLQALKASQNLNIALSTMSTSVGLPATVKLNLSNKEQEIKENKVLNKQLEKFIEIATSSRPDLKSKIAEVKMASSDVYIARTKFLPTLSAYASKSWNDNTDPTFKNYGSDRDAFGIGVKLSLPLFSGFRDFYGLSSEKYNLEAKQQNLKSYKQDVELSVVKAFYSYKTAIKAVEIAKKLFESATENEKVAIGSYETGVGNIISVMKAQTALLDARKEYISAKYGFYISRAELLKSVGMLKTNNIKDMKL